MQNVECRNKTAKPSTKARAPTRPNNPHDGQPFVVGASTSQPKRSERARPTVGDDVRRRAFGPRRSQNKKSRAALYPTETPPPKPRQPSTQTPPTHQSGVTIHESGIRIQKSRILLPFPPAIRYNHRHPRHAPAFLPMNRLTLKLSRNHGQDNHQRVSPRSSSRVD